jgi:hypothetical protein
MAEKKPAAKGPAKISKRESPENAGPREQQSRRPDPEQVARRAYERFVQRGGEHGRDLEDWVAAEKELGGQNR